MTNPVDPGVEMDLLNPGEDDDNAQEYVNEGRGDRPSAEAPRADTATQQLQREGQRLNDNAVQRLRASSSGGGARQGQPAVEPIYDKVNLSPYGPGPTAREVHNYEAASAPFHADYDRPPPPEMVERYATEHQITVPDALKKIVAARKEIATQRAQQMENYSRVYGRAVLETQAVRKGPGAAKVASAIFGFLALGLAVATATLAVFFTKATAANNPPAPAREDDPLEVHPISANGFEFGLPARVNILPFAIGFAPGSLAFVGVNSAAAQTLTVTGEGAWSIDGNSIVFTPEAGFYGNPKPVSYRLTSKADSSKTTDAAITFIYDSGFRVDSIIQTTFKKGNPAEILFLLSAVGADPMTAKLLDANKDSSDSSKKTVAAQGVWTLDRATSKISFTPAANFFDNPDPIRFSVSTTKGDHTAERFIALIDEDLVVSNQIRKADPGQAFSVAGFAVSGAVIDASTLKIVDGTTQATVLKVKDQGTWSIDSAGVLSFKPDASFKQLPASIKLTVADSLGRRCEPFTLAAVPFVAPYALNEFKAKTPAAIGQMSGTSITCLAATSAIRGDFDIKLASVQIVGLMAFDNSLPAATWVTQHVELKVPGEGIWKANNDGTITFTFDANPVRWPTPIAYTVQDINGHESNIGLIWITAEQMTEVDQTFAGINDLTDIAFWSKYHDNVLAKQLTLGELLSATFLLERMAFDGASVNAQNQINALPVLTNTAVDAVYMNWLMGNASPTTLADVTKGVDDTYVATLIGKSALDIYGLVTRVLRLRMVEAVLTKSMST